ncbi:tetratricopeptide repeat protein [Pseudonocardia sp. KRD-182]|uniref:tetratricopeptide repeat protein n=1 Tax=Pseudonocardia oceani TaxID=2792013 RepID=UPI001C49D1E3|nr:tetratricopeptide repeat protein [Pseudonocardia oceani]MBW0108835.1 tetratricopeptide repeat protein [Pseudonocardia oceani]
MSPPEEILRQTADQAVRDIVELDRQVACGEIGEADASALRAGYEARAAQSLGALDVTDPPAPAPLRAPRAWSLAYLLAGAVAVVAALVLLPASMIERPVGGFVTGNEAVQGGASALDPAATVTDAQLEEVVAANPGVVGMRLALADRYVAQGDFGPAMRHYLDALRREPDNAEAHAHLGWLLLQIGQPQDAAESVDRALALDPSLDDALWFRANIALDGLDDPAAALASLAELGRRELSPAVRTQVEQLTATAQQRLGSAG